MTDKTQRAQQQWQTFLQDWPLERVEQLTLQDYYTPKNDTGFFQNLLKRTHDIGVFEEGPLSAGIRPRPDTRKEKQISENVRTDGNYIWYAMLGETAETAFETLKNELLISVRAAAKGDLKAIDNLSKAPGAMIWKVAFLYQDQQHPRLMPFYKRDQLRSVVPDGSGVNTVELHQRLLAGRGETPLLEYAERLWTDAELRRNTTEEVEKTIKRFASDPRLSKSLRTPEERQRFHRLALAVHEHGLDWWTVNLDKGGSIRFGRKKSSSRNNTRTLVMLDPQQGGVKVWLGEISEQAWEPLSDTVLELVARPDFAKDFRLENEVDRPGRWPSDYPINEEVGSIEPTQSLNEEVMKRNTPPLNQILFGPPGTGKTYASIEAALEILDPEFLANHYKVREELKKRFDELVEANLVRFVTFHQSFSYEDFVEGLRAETDETSKQISYNVVDGVFKNLCVVSSAKVIQQAQTTIDIKGRTIWKMSLGNTLGTDAGIYDECLAGGYILLGYGDRIDFSNCKTRDQVFQRYQQSGKVTDSGDYAVTSVDTFINQMKPGDLVVVSDGNFKFRAIAEITSEYQFKPHASDPNGYCQMRQVKWLRNYEPSLPYDELMNNQFSQMTIYNLRPKSINLGKLAALLTVSKPGDAKVTEAMPSGLDKPRVLIIDEINRGNISRIFGELITLIEPSKRAGADEALEVVLPYSKDRFSVPKNVYLIGTMNTADRSLAGLDIALRRRFVFREMPPRPDLLDGVLVEKAIYIGRLLRIMNERIAVLLDRDHCLGHAYFMSLKDNPSLDNLAGIFRNQVLPLLQEYFFEDWQRIQWVLNDHRKSGPDCFVCQAENQLGNLFGSEVIGVSTKPGWWINDEAFERLEAYLGIIDHELKPVSTVQRQATHGNYTISLLQSGSIEIKEDNKAVAVCMPVLRKIAGELSISVETDSGRIMNTRTLGRKVLDALGANPA